MFRKQKHQESERDTPHIEEGNFMAPQALRTQPYGAFPRRFDEKLR